MSYIYDDTRGKRFPGGESILGNLMGGAGMSEKIMKYCLLGISIFLGGYLLARGYLYLRENSSQDVCQVLQNVCETVEERALLLCFPQYMNAQEQEDYWIEKNKIQSLSALFQYVEQHVVPDTMEEDELMTNEIIKLHNKLLVDEILLENQESKLQDEESKQQDLPVWAKMDQENVKEKISLEDLSDVSYLLRKFFVVDADTTADRALFSAETFLQKDLTIDQNDKPQILIYHTHSQEGYVDSVDGEEDTTVVGVGNYLTELLEEIFGYQVIHIKDAFDMVEGKLERSHAYNYALPVVEKVLEENPSIEVVIDLHRDGVNENTHLVTTVNGKPTAKIMFFNGLSRNSQGEDRTSIPNAYLADNLAFSFQLAYEAKSYYPDFIRCIYLKGYRYNLHVRPRALLLEVGAQTNTVEEAKNAMEPFSVILNKVLNEE